MNYQELVYMPVQNLIDKLIKIGEKYPQKKDSFIDSLQFWNKHDNQKVAEELKAIKNAITADIPEKLQEVELLAKLVKILSLPDFTYSSNLLPELKKELAAYDSYKDLDTYLPDDINKDYPKIKELRDALFTLGKILHHQYELEESVNKAKAGNRGKNTSEEPSSWHVRTP